VVVNGNGNDRLAVHAVWAGAAMYCVAILGLAAAKFSPGAPESATADVVTAKLIALFGPIASIIAIALYRRKQS
jgi:hypothetical protein